LGKASGSFGPPIPRQVISEQVAQRILGLIQQGEFDPGQRLPGERDLAEQLGVSRPILREALRALSILGVLIKRQGSGVYVSPLSPEVLLAPLQFFISVGPPHQQSLSEARIIMESGIVRLATERMTPETLGRLRACIEEAEGNSDDPALWLQTDLEFHRLIVESANNPFLTKVAQSFQVLGKASRETAVKVAGVRQQSQLEHKRILTALEQGDPVGAEAAMRQHLEHAYAHSAEWAEETDNRVSGTTSAPDDESDA